MHIINIDATIERRRRQERYKQRWKRNKITRVFHWVCHARKSCGNSSSKKASRAQYFLLLSRDLRDFHHHHLLYCDFDVQREQTSLTNIQFTSPQQKKDIRSSTSLSVDDITSWFWSREQVNNTKFMCFRLSLYISCRFFFCCCRRGSRASYISHIGETSSVATIQTKWFILCKFKNKLSRINCLFIIMCVSWDDADDDDDIVDAAKRNFLASRLETERAWREGVKRKWTKK